MTMKKLLFAIVVFASGVLTHLGAANPVIITEFMAGDTPTLQDENGTRRDWVKIQNARAGAVNLDGGHLTDPAQELTEGRFLAASIAPGGFRVPCHSPASPA
jgi:hypothetical protein